MTCSWASTCCAKGSTSPECGLVCILDADKEGFLRSETSLIQTIGRAARNVEGRVILLRRPHHRQHGARDGGDRPPPREATRVQHRTRHHAPQRSSAASRTSSRHTASQDGVTIGTGDPERNNLVGHNLRGYIEDLEKRMRNAAANLEFEGSRQAARRNPAARKRRTRHSRSGQEGAAGWEEQRGQARHAEDAVWESTLQEDEREAVTLFLTPPVTTLATLLCQRILRTDF